MDNKEFLLELAIAINNVNKNQLETNKILREIKDATYLCNEYRSVSALLNDGGFVITEEVIQKCESACLKYSKKSGYRVIELDKESHNLYHPEVLAIVLASEIGSDDDDYDDE